MDVALHACILITIIILLWLMRMERHVIRFCLQIQRESFTCIGFITLSIRSTIKSLLQLSLVKLRIGFVLMWKS